MLFTQITRIWDGIKEFQRFEINKIRLNQPSASTLTLVWCLLSSNSSQTLADSNFVVIWPTRYSLRIRSVKRDLFEVKYQSCKNFVRLPNFGRVYSLLGNKRFYSNQPPMTSTTASIFIDTELWNCCRVSLPESILRILC